MAHVVVSALVFVAAACVIALFVMPLQNPWFWPMAGLAVLSGAAALLIPMPKR